MVKSLYRDQKQWPVLLSGHSPLEYASLALDANSRRVTVCRKCFDTRIYRAVETVRRLQLYGVPDNGAISGYQNTPAVNSVQPAHGSCSRLQYPVPPRRDETEWRSPGTLTPLQQRQPSSRTKQSLFIIYSIMAHVCSPRVLVFPQMHILVYQP